MKAPSNPDFLVYFPYFGVDNKFAGWEWVCTMPLDTDCILYSEWNWWQIKSVFQDTVHLTYNGSLYAILVWQAMKFLNWLVTHWKLCKLIFTINRKFTNYSTPPPPSNKKKNYLHGEEHHWYKYIQKFVFVLFFFRGGGTI